MNLDIREEALSPVAQPELAAILIVFVVDRVLEVRLLDGGLGSVSLAETAVTDPHVKDYDALRGAGPARWPGRLDVSNPGLIRARQDGTSVRSAVIATSTPDLHMLGGRGEVAVPWEIRVSPRDRAGGTGSRLYRAAGDRAGARGCRWLKIETQNVNLAARRFYQKMGCTLGTSDRFAYPGQPGEVQRLWWKALASTYTESSRSELRAQPQALPRPLPRRPVDRRPIRVGFKAYAAHAESRALVACIFMR
jgi:GNAT superfamily N-acetyltransferase